MSTRFAATLALAAAAGCFAKTPIADNPVDTDGTTATSDAGGDETDGATGQLPAPDVVDGAVDCSTLPAAGPTVAGGELSPLGFPEYRCNPRQTPADPTNTEYTCCSVDPAAEGGALPDYMGKGIGGSIPYFSGVNNEFSSWGMCVRTSDLPSGSGLSEPAAAGCPIPCNPTWSDGDIETVCGTGRVCCQTHELQPEDCVVDPVSGQWRPVSGEDIGIPYDDGTAVTSWGLGEHATQQDPGGEICLGFAGGDQMVFAECAVELSVADQRGVCMALSAAQVCPHQQPSYVDACAQL